MPKSRLTWEELHAEYTQWCSEPGQVKRKEERGLPDVKKWLDHRYGATIDEHTVAGAAEQMDSNPIEFTRLLEQLTELVGGRDP